MNLRIFPCLIPICLSLALPCCESEKSGSEVPHSLTPAQEEVCLSKSNQAIQSLMEKLSTQLKAALKAGGPENAVKICGQVAEPLTGSTNVELDGLTISRTSLKFRNYKNAPDQVDRGVLEKWQAFSDSKQALPGHELIPLGQGRALFYKPIVTQSICLRCHGSVENFSPELLTILEQHYPHDKAREYKEGDLRGAFRVMIDLNVAASEK